jgi:hypothetical protein
MRESLGGTKKIPHPELVEGRTALIPSSSAIFQDSAALSASP